MKKLGAFSALFALAMFSLAMLLPAGAQDPPPPCPTNSVCDPPEMFGFSETNIDPNRCDNPPSRTPQPGDPICDVLPNAEQQSTTTARPAAAVAPPVRSAPRFTG